MAEKHWRFAFFILTAGTWAPVGLVFWLTKVAASRGDLFFGVSIVIGVLLGVAGAFAIYRLPLKIAALVALLGVGAHCYFWINLSSQ